MAKTGGALSCCSTVAKVPSANAKLVKLNPLKTIRLGIPDGLLHFEFALVGCIHGCIPALPIGLLKSAIHHDHLRQQIQPDYLERSLNHGRTQFRFAHGLLPQKPQYPNNIRVFSLSGIEMIYLLAVKGRNVL